MLLFLTLPKSVSAQVVINEFQIKPNNWIELYNKSEVTIDISGWAVDDDGGSQKYVVSAGTILDSKKCISFQSGNFNWNSSSADDIRLFDAQNNLVESYHYDISPDDNISIGKAIDGDGVLSILSSSSRDKLNATGDNCLQPTPTPVVTTAPTNESTQSPTKSPSPTASPTSKPSPTKSPSPKPTASPTEESEETNEPTISISDINVIEATPTGLVAGTTTTNKKPIIAFIFIFAGVLFLGYGGYLLYNMNIKNNDKRDEYTKDKDT